MRRAFRLIELVECGGLPFAAVALEVALNTALLALSAALLVLLALAAAALLVLLPLTRALALTVGLVLLILVGHDWFLFISER